MQIVAVIVAVVVVVNLVSLAINQLGFRHELDGRQPYGQLMAVDGRFMHVYAMGQGPRTIVLLPGYGVPLPSADFGPLMRALSASYTVVCVEYFGVGFSDQTTTPRTNENYVQEIRSALDAAGFAPPYLLMPHSASGIYAEFYASTHPEEVSAIIMLDTTSSATMPAAVPGFVYGLAKVQQAIGLARFVNPLIVRSTLGLTAEHGYTTQEIADYTAFMNHSTNDTTIDQMARLNDNIRAVMGMAFPGTVPVLELASSETVKRMGEAYETDHLRRLGSGARLTILDGTHFLYHGGVQPIVDATEAFLRDA